ncbi:Gfo/Idh/MocA family oxidoreductase [Microbacterium sp. CFH 90308]|uniref:Gfo/Idh/MocA family oxidoreductase n=1 Tax=Microbacterium salsuginis TaxID=2722803 RepID=A0ABX1K863_9MICO|nr:Gfo/Idh/MocA family oxidoreductase [Microbacterium sp. CFH 90308]NLP83207.1 Gfo/Idh/MocA family oxidoreductase [Microbacterium sp. CFH 90308]
MTSQETARVAVVGAGGIGAAAHLPAVQSLGDEAQLVAIVDLDADRRAEAGNRFGCTDLYSGIEEMLAAKRPDVVALATPPHLHEAMAIEVMRAGAWAYCEKPLTGSLASADRIIAAERDTGRWCVSVSQFRYAGGSQQAYAALRNRRWGRPLIGVAHTNWYRGPEYWDIPWRGKFRTEFGGATTTQAYHAIDLLVWLMGGDWATVSGVADTLARPIEVEDTSAAVVRFQSGAIASLLSTVLSSRQETHLQVTTERATLGLDTLYLPQQDEWSVRQLDGEGVTRIVDDWPEPEPPLEVNAHRAQLRGILAAWREGRRPDVTAADARSTLELLTALYKSSATERSVARGEIAQGDPFYDALDAAGPSRKQAIVHV